MELDPAVESPHSQTEIAISEPTIRTRSMVKEVTSTRMETSTWEVGTWIPDMARALIDL